MKYHELQTNSSKDRKRVGRGISAGQGKTAGRGTKGQNSRTGKKLKPTFAGGSRSIVQAVPKLKGFKSIRVPAQVVYLDELNAVKGATIDNEKVFAAGLVATPNHVIKVIGRGEYTGKATIKLQNASASVKAAIAKSGGTFEAVAVPLKQSTKAEKMAKKAEKG